MVVRRAMKFILKVSSSPYNAKSGLKRYILTLMQWSSSSFMATVPSIPISLFFSTGTLKPSQLPLDSSGKYAMFRYLLNIFNTTELKCEQNITEQGTKLSYIIATVSIVVFRYVVVEYGELHRLAHQKILCLHHHITLLDIFSKLLNI